MTPPTAPHSRNAVQIRTTSRPASSRWSASCVTIGTPRASAVAAIHESFTGMRSPRSRKRIRSRAHASATLSSTGIGCSSSARIRVLRRRSRMLTSTAASTPALSAPIVMIETAISSGRRVTSSARPGSVAMKMLVSASPLVTRAGARRSCREQDSGDRRGVRRRLDC